MEGPSSHITQSIISLLKEHEEEHESVIDTGSFTDHILPLQLGLVYLQTFLCISDNEDLKLCINRILSDVRLELHSLSNRLLDGNFIPELDSAYSELREKVKNAIIHTETGEFNVVMGLDNGFVLTISRNLSSCSTDVVAPLMKKIEDVKETLLFLQPLLNYVTDFEVRITKGNKKHCDRLIAFLDKATCLLYSCSVDKMDEEIALEMKHKLSDLLENVDVKDIYIEVLKLRVSELNEATNNSLEEEFYLLDNLMKLLDCNARICLNDSSEKLRAKLKFSTTFVVDLPHELRLEKFNYLLKSIEAITYKALPILYSCYDKDMKEDRAMEVNGALSEVIDQIEDIHMEVREIKLYSYPKTDELGFLDLFLGHLEELLKYRPELIEFLKSQTETLIVKFDFLRGFLRKIKDHYNEHEDLRDLWINIIGLAYQAEYIISFYLVKYAPDSRIILSLTKVIERTEFIISKVTTISVEEKYHTRARDVAMASKYVPSQTSAITTGDVVGFADEAEKIMKWLVGDTKQRDVVSIVGLPGLGKTTLARKMFEDPLLSEHFDVRAWCTVSQTYRRRELLLTILGDIPRITGETDKLNDEELAAKLYQSLKGRRYLIVIDDLWHIEAWNDLVRSFPEDKNNSRILITSRLLNVASQIKVSKMHRLREFSNDESWELFQKKLFPNESFSKEILDVGKEIVASCRGLPLAIVVIAGLLTKMEKSVDKWKQIALNLNSYIFSDSESQCKAILELSYNNLPDYLKSCYLYFGMFAEDQEILVRKLKFLWIAEGFVRNSEAKNLEVVAEDYFEDLISRSLVTATKERSRGKVKTCRVHDLLRDFCLEKAKEESFLQVIKLNPFSEFSRVYDQHRLSIYSEMSYIKRAMPTGCSVRSILYTANSAYGDISFLFSNFKLLRVLDLGGVDIGENFSGIELLIHLRYLAVKAHLSSLPSSISNLWNLQFLFILANSDSDKQVVDVPESFWGMVNLRHVDIYSCAFSKVDSSRVNSCSLDNLGTLSGPRLCSGEDAENLFRMLPKLRELRCTYYVCEDDYTKVHHFPALNFLDQLMSLSVCFDDTWLRQENFMFIFPSNLRKLTLSKFPGNLDEISKIGRTLPNLEVLKLIEPIERAGRNLEVSNLDKFDWDKTWSVDDDDFPKLKYLKLRSLNIVEWIASDDSFPILKELVLDCCGNLNEIPPCFGDIPTLQMITVDCCESSVEDSARIIQKKQHEEWQNYELKVNIYGKITEEDFIIGMKKYLDSAAPASNDIGTILSMFRRGN